MGSLARSNFEAIRKFERYWEDLFEEFPAARAAAVNEMGKAVKEDLDAQILSQGVDDLFGHIRNTQEVRFGSRGGYAAVSPVASEMTDRYGRTKTWKGQQVSTRQVTRWLEKGHGARKPSGSAKKYRLQLRGASFGKKGNLYIKGHLFYSWTKLRALDHALSAANKAMEIFAEKNGV